VGAKGEADMGMRDSTGTDFTQLNLFEVQLKHDAEQRLLQRMTELLVSSARGVAVLNSGAAIAILSLFSALATKDHPVSKFKTPGMWAFGIFLAGAFLASLVAIAHRRQIHYQHYQHSGEAGKMKRLTESLLGISANAFVIGGIFAAYGIWASL
jgi:hypothetical protein